MSNSPWPIFMGFGLMFLAVGFVEWMYSHSFPMLIVGWTVILLTAFQWFRDLLRESTFLGEHTLEVRNGLRTGMILFITSEVMFFFSLFFAFFSTSLSPNMETGLIWPPVGVGLIRVEGVPLLNTLLLLSSGVTITWAHHSILSSSKGESILGLSLSCLLGGLFTFAQGKEYYDLCFSIADSVYGSLFYILTGFHGMHVLVGTIFLLVSLARLWSSHFSNKQHLGFELGAWYWHFVDVVWLLLFLSVYWWGS